MIEVTALWAALAVTGAAAAPDLTGAGGGGVRSVAADTTAAVHLLRRATFGAKADELTALLDMGAEAWLERQLHPERIEEDLGARLSRHPASEMSTVELYDSYPPPQLLRSRLPDRDSVRPEDIQRLRREMGVQGPGRILFDLSGAKLQRAVYSERQLYEVMSDFWFNHFNVFWGKGADRWLVADYEREAIRPHVFGRFEDMLRSTASHPAMLFYLDNWQSAVPDSLNPALARLDRGRRRWESLSSSQRQRLVRSGRVTPQQVQQLERRRESQPGDRQRGINENYARELMELHTLGVDGGYKQDDVIEVARALTGWTITRPGLSPRMADGGTVEFVYRPEMHYPGAKQVLDLHVAGDAGMAEGERILQMLARHPSTARHIATKLAVAFVADEPPESLIGRLSQTFLDTDGDLREVTRALFLSEEFQDPRYRGAKVKSPFELVASALRVTGADFGPSRGVFETLRALDHTPYMSIVPTGYPEMSEDWTSSGSLLQRLNFGLALSSGQLENVRVAGFSDLADSPDVFVPQILAVVLPGVELTSIAETILADLETSAGVGVPAAARRAGLRAGTASDLSASQMRALGLALGSPNFQRH